MISAEEIEQHLSVGQSVVMLPDPPDRAYRERLHLRGWQRGKYLLLDAEVTQETRTVFRADSRCVLRFVSDGFACVGHSTVQDLGSGSHFSYMRVKWPDTFTSVPVRRYERVRVHAQCQISDGQRTVEGEVTDLSVGGCRILADEAFAVDADCQLTFALPDGSSINGVSVAICNCTRSGTRHSLGCTFSDRDQLAWSDIEFYVATTLTRLRGESPESASVLVLEAEPRNIQIARAMMEREGYQVAITQSAVDAFFMLRMHAPEVLLVNLAVPDMDVATLCSTLRASRRFEMLPIVVYGANERDAQAAIDAGATEYVPEISSVNDTRALIERYAAAARPQAATG